MVQFMTSYFNAMDREFEERSVTPIEKESSSDIERPLIPISQIGTTSIDVGTGNILQELEKNIHMGTSKIQIVFGPGGRGGISSGPSAYGKEVRAALREKAKATGVDIIGVELSPAQISGLAGFDPQSGRLSEQKRHADMNKVRDAIRFAADVSRGGCVDLWSQEFNRSVIDAEWNKDGNGKKIFFGNTPEELKDIKKAKITKYLVDARTGEPIRESVVQTDDKVTLPKYRTAGDANLKVDPTGRKLKPTDLIDYEGKYVDPDDKEAYTKLVPLMDSSGQLQVEFLNWDDVEKRTKAHNDRLGLTGDKRKKPEEWYYERKLSSQLAQARGQVSYYGHDLSTYYGQLDDFKKERDFAKKIEGGMSPEAKREWVTSNVIAGMRMRGEMPSAEREKLLGMNPSEAVQHQINRHLETIRGFQEQALAAKMNLREVEDKIGNIRTPQNFAQDRSFESYAQLGIEAMQVTKERNLERPVYIGPELGWAGDAYGGHPREFIDLIKKSREKMKDALIAKGYDKDAASNAAKTHIKGMLDTSHLAMWYKHFAREDGETDEKHLKRFQEWMKVEAVNMVKEGVVGGVQVVDSITGEHSHLPAGQGSFDVAGVVQEMTKAGFKGNIIAEGHEEDTGGFGQGRILTETWRAFGAPISSVPAGQQSGMRGWGGINRSYFGHTNPTTYVVGAYAPSNEWQPWSELGFD